MPLVTSSSCRSTCCLTALSLSVAQMVARSGSTSRSSEATTTAAPLGAAASLRSMMWHSTLMSWSSLRPSTRCSRNCGSSSLSGQPSSSVSMHSKAALRSSSPSSTVCLKGPRSTWCTSSGRFLVCSYSIGSSSGRASRTAAGLLCATQLSASSAPRRTLRSASSRVTRNWRSAASSTAGMGAPLANSVSVKRSELTTAARVSAEACDSRASSAGTTASGATAASLPRHSATTLRTPSSSRSANSKSRGSICST
mmetsp:Transcript_62523/g.150745  ORF Transcript_62523/g.150745 Transcript_62523/m.150745 type:complete len:254 (+) Transcript_62523:369-1130(+)